MRRPEGITVLALYFFAMSIPSLIGALCLLAGAITTGFSVETIDFGIFAGIAALVVVMILAFGLGILFFATALGLWRVRSWSRWLSIVISILSLLAFPIGTIIGAQIGVLLAKRTKQKTLKMILSVVSLLFSIRLIIGLFWA